MTTLLILTVILAAIALYVIEIIRQAADYLERMHKEVLWHNHQIKEKELYIDLNELPTVWDRVKETIFKR